MSKRGAVSSICMYGPVVVIFSLSQFKGLTILKTGSWLKITFPTSTLVQPFSSCPALGVHLLGIYNKTMSAPSCPEEPTEHICFHKMASY